MRFKFLTYSRNVSAFGLINSSRVGSLKKYVRSIHCQYFVLMLIISFFCPDSTLPTVNLLQKLLAKQSKHSIRVIAFEILLRFIDALVHSTTLKAVRFYPSLLSFFSFSPHLPFVVLSHPLFPLLSTFQRFFAFLLGSK